MTNEYRRRSGRTNRPNELEGFEVAAKITGAGAKNIAVLPYSILKEEKENQKGQSKAYQYAPFWQGAESFTVKNGDLKVFTQEAKVRRILLPVGQRKTKTQMPRSM